MQRAVIGVIVGLIVGFGVIAIGEFMGRAAVPHPPGLDFSNAEAARESFKKLEPKHFIPVWLAHVAGTAAAAFVAQSIARQSPILLGIVVAGVFELVAAVNIVLLPHPAWFVALDLMSYAPAAIVSAIVAWKLFGGGALLPRGWNPGVSAD
jgi:hypothetical protein